MNIFIDADACPVIKIVENVAQKNNIKCYILCDTNHYMQSDYSEVIVVSAGMDAVDFKILNLCKKNDIVVTQDYGLASLVLSKKAHAIHHSGMLYTENNIDKLLFQRYVNKTEKKKGNKINIKIKKRTSKDDLNFRESFEKLIKALKKEV